MKRLGERIKKRRLLLDLHLNELAEKADISSSALSQIEHSKSYPSILTLKSLADALHTTIGELIGENESSATSPVIQKSNIKFVEQNNSGTSVFLLSDHDPHNHMDTYLLRFPKAASLEGLFEKAHNQVFCHILSGDIAFELNEKHYVLKTGDNIYFNAKTPHNAINESDNMAEVLWVQSPPNF